MSDLDIHLTFLLFWTNLTACGPESYKIIILSLQKKPNYKKMDSNLISDKRHLFALSIVDDALDDWSEERRTEMIISITEIKESMLKENTKKYQNNEGGQNNAKVSK